MIPGVVAIMAGLVTGGGGGGGTTPVETAYSGFKTATYRLDGSTATLGDLWEQNTDYGTWDASGVDAGVGLHPTGSARAPCLTSAARAVVSPSEAGFVAVLEIDITDSTNRIDMDMVHLSAFDVYLGFSIEDDSLAVYSESTSDSVAGVPTGPSKVAVRITQTGVDVKTEGGLTLSLSGSVPTANNIGLTLTRLSSAALTVEAVTFYQATADLDLALAL